MNNSVRSDGIPSDTPSSPDISLEELRGNIEVAHKQLAAGMNNRRQQRILMGTQSRLEKQKVQEAVIALVKARIKVIFPEVILEDELFERCEVINNRVVDVSLKVKEGMESIISLIHNQTAAGFVDNETGILFDYSDVGSRLEASLNGNGRKF